MEHTSKVEWEGHERPVFKASESLDFSFGSKLANTILLICKLLLHK